MSTLGCLIRITVCGLACSLTGCCFQCGNLFCDRCADIRPGAIPLPIGAHTGAWQSAQEALAERDDMVFYQYEWIGSTAELSPFGQRHLAEIIHRQGILPEPLIIEPSDNPDLDADRVAALVNQLSAAGIDAAHAMIRLGYATAEGIHGQEAFGLSQGYFGGTGGRGLRGAAVGGLGGSAIGGVRTGGGIGGSGPAF